MPVRYLPDHLVNQIAAGEVVERPAAALKELIENAIDAGARHIDIDIRDGGKTLMRVSDDGCGMDKADLQAALDRHATSKLGEDSLDDIHTFGFRGEALPSIGSVSHMTVKSKSPNGDEAWQVIVDNGRKTPLIPCAHAKGTVIEIRDIFKLTPGRLKFLKTDRAEFTAIRDVVMRQAMANANVSIKLTHNDKVSLSLQSPANIQSEEDFIRRRAAQIMGNDFVDNAIYIDQKNEQGIHLYGLASLPTYHKATAQNQYFFVNQRPVRDKLLHGVTRAAYMDVLPGDRHASVILYVDLPPGDVDVNVHPAKAEVRFREPQTVRKTIISTLRHALYEYGGKTSTHITDKLATRLKDTRSFFGQSGGQTARGFTSQTGTGGHYGNLELKEKTFESYKPLVNHAPSARMDITEAPLSESNTESRSDYPLGAARAQIHENYIVAQTTEGLVIVDQHAAHERLVYEKMKRQMAESGVFSQNLLSPEIVELNHDEMEALISSKKTLSAFGLDIDSFGPKAISINAVPSILQGKIDWQRLIRDIAETLLDNEERNVLQEKIYERLATAACHGSVRSGRRMNADEMNALLREMEKTPLSGQCNHGRPTYITLQLSDIESLFGRK